VLREAGGEISRRHLQTVTGDLERRIRIRKAMGEW
jgi:hypothetical protein